VHPAVIDAYANGEVAVSPPSSSVSETGEIVALLRKASRANRPHGKRNAAGRR
jgi:hypothetical protein